MNKTRSSWVEDFHQRSVFLQYAPVIGPLGASGGVKRNFAEFIYLPDQICIHLVRIKDSGSHKLSPFPIKLQIVLSANPITARLIYFSCQKKKELLSANSLRRRSTGRQTESRSSNPSLVKLEQFVCENTDRSRCNIPFFQLIKSFIVLMLHFIG